MPQATCATCATTFTAKTTRRRFCSDRCRERGRPRIPCTTCAGPTGYSTAQRKKAGDSPICNPCRTAATRERHGTVSCYRLGCRCDECRRVWNEQCAEYRRAARKAGRYPRGREPARRECEVCGKWLKSKGGAADGRSLCKPHRDAARPHYKAWISVTDRLAIYERDSWTCQLCFEPIDRGAHYQDDWSPTLDHIIPRSHQLVPDDSPSNLRTAHRWCNSVRGDLSYYVDEDLTGREANVPHFLPQAS